MVTLNFSIVSTVITTFIGILFVTNLFWGIKTISNFNQEGIGLNSVEYRSSELFSIVSNLALDARVFSNEPSSLFFHSNRTVEISPLKRHFIKNDKMVFDYVKYQTGYLVLFNDYEKMRKRWLYNKSELKTFLNLSLMYEDTYGSIYSIDSVIPK